MVEDGLGALLLLAPLCLPPCLLLLDLGEVVLEIVSEVTHGQPNLLVGAPKLGFPLLQQLQRLFTQGGRHCRRAWERVVGLEPHHVLQEKGKARCEQRP